MPATPPHAQPCIGIDFSGGTRAGRKVWIAQGHRTADRTVRIERCDRLTDLLGVAPARDIALPALRAWIARQHAAIIGMDFPFGVPAALMPRGQRWVTWCVRLGACYTDAESFRADCTRRAGGREIKRATDVAACTPLASYNLWVYRQTYHGVRDVLAPLVAADAARVVPMQRRAAGLPTLIEVCPASTLKVIDAYLPRYKGADRAAPGRGATPSATRAAIVDLLVRRTGASLPPQVRAAAVADAEGDALDAVVACLAAGGAMPPPPLPPVARREGCVFTGV